MPDAFDSPAQDASDQAAAPEQSFGAALREFGRKMNPLPMIQGLAQTAAHPIEALKSYGAQNERILSDAEGAFNRGNYIGAARHGLDYVLNGIPGLGLPAEAVGAIPAARIASAGLAGAREALAARAAEAAGEAVDPELLDGLAQGFKCKNFASADPVTQTAIRDIAGSVQAGGVAEDPAPANTPHEDPNWWMTPEERARAAQAAQPAPAPPLAQSPAARPSPAPEEPETTPGALLRETPKPPAPRVEPTQGGMGGMKQFRGDYNRPS